MNIMFETLATVATMAKQQSTKCLLFSKGISNFTPFVTNYLHPFLITLNFIIFVLLRINSPPCKKYGIHEPSLFLKRISLHVIIKLNSYKLKRLKWEHVGGRDCVCRSLRRIAFYIGSEPIFCRDLPCNCCQTMNGKLFLLIVSNPTVSHKFAVPFDCAFLLFFQFPNRIKSNRIVSHSK